MENKYAKLKKIHEERLNNFPIKFAFSNSQFEKAMEDLGLSKNDTDKVASIGVGGIIKKEDQKSFEDMLEKNKTELEEKIKNDPTGEGFITDMFEYELNNHEYTVTRDTSDALDVFGYSMQDVINNGKLSKGLTLAKERILAWEEENC